MSLLDNDDLKKAIILIIILLLAFMFVLIALEKLGIQLEGDYIDLWSIVHFLSGVLIGLLCFRWWTALALLTLWEIIEPTIYFILWALGLAERPEFPEVPTNSVTDIIVGFAGYLFARRWKKKLKKK